MRSKTLLAAAAAISLSTAALAQESAEFTPERFRAHVTFLADDLLEGREAGSRGYEIAARYVASRYAALGLDPAADGSWFQRVPFVEFRSKGEPSLSIDGENFTHGEDFLIRPSPHAEALNIEAPVVFVGYGLDAPTYGLNDYAGLDVRGKIVVTLSGMPTGVPSDVRGHLSQDKARMAEKHGAVGMITLLRRADAERLPWARMRPYASRSGLTWIGPDGQPSTEAPGIRFGMTLNADTAETLFEGAPTSLDAILDQTANEDERPRGFALGKTVRVQRENALSEFTSPNVVAVLPGSDPALANEYVLLMAHLDGLGIADEKPSDTAETDRIRNGAMDNATGVATLLEVARQMAASPDRPRRPILFAAVTAEEKGLLGGEYLAHNVPGGGRVVSVVNLDMPILTYDFQDVIAFGAEHSTMGPIVERAAARMNVALSEDPLPQERLFTRSDHYPFVQRGVPAVFLMTGFAGEGQKQFTGFLGDQYHSPRDDLDLPFNWEAGAKFARLNYLIAREIADAPIAPRWYSDSFFGNVFGGDQPRAER